MTKKEIEERLKQEMQQNIPNKDALWQRIENQLPEQPVHKKIRMYSGRQFLTAAACFLVVIAGIRFMNQHKLLKDSENVSNIAPAEDNHIMLEQDGADVEADDEGEEKQFNSGAELKSEHKQNLLNYQNLQIDHGNIIASQVDCSKLGTEGEYFQEDDILKHTEFFIDVRVTEGMQESSGIMHYVLQVIEVYGDELNTEEIILETNSAYILELNHEYVLPVYYQENHEFALAYECAPQIERTQDHKLVIPNGWYTLMQLDAVPIQYDRYGIDDYFYDRMYLTPDLNLELLLQKFENL